MLVEVSLTGLFFKGFMTAYYQAPTETFLAEDLDKILSKLLQSDSASGFSQVSQRQIGSWRLTIPGLKKAISESGKRGAINGVVLEYRIPRREKRIDCALVCGKEAIVIEFKAGSSTESEIAVSQVVDYALDLRNYHKASHDLSIHAIVCATEFLGSRDLSAEAPLGIASLSLCGLPNLASVIDQVVSSPGGGLTAKEWADSRYAPIPGILDAVGLMFARNDAREINECLASSDTIEATLAYIWTITRRAHATGRNHLLLVTGVPGSGKTLVGLKLAHQATSHGIQATYLSGNGPLLKVLRASLTIDYAKHNECTKAYACNYAEALLHSVHSFIQESRLSSDPPAESLIVFDEAQRAWDEHKMTKMRTRQQRAESSEDNEPKGTPPGPAASEPASIIEIMSRPRPEGTLGVVVVALCGGGQEIHDGEAGVAEWINASRRHQDWTVLSGTQEAADSKHVQTIDHLTLTVSMRSHRASRHAEWVDLVLKGDADRARGVRQNASHPIYLARHLDSAREFLGGVNLGTRRFGILASSGAARLRPYGLEVSAEFRKGIDYPLWFTAAKGDLRSSCALEVAATEFECQGLELDWAVMVWSWDMPLGMLGFEPRAYRGSEWKPIAKGRRSEYTVNKYRVLLTRAREGMVIVVPKGDRHDRTRSVDQMDGVARFLLSAGVEPLPESPTSNTRTSQEVASG